MKLSNHVVTSELARGKWMHKMPVGSA